MCGEQCVTSRTHCGEQGHTDYTPEERHIHVNITPPKTYKSQKTLYNITSNLYARLTQVYVGARREIGILHLLNKHDLFDFGRSMHHHTIKIN
jgi:hypothetical protein